MNSLVIYTDGAYSSSRDLGGLAIVFTKNDELVMKAYSKGYAHTTNNQMELGAVYLALKSIRKPIDSLTIVTDSQYVIGCGTQGWNRKKNLKLWAAFDKAYAHALTLCSNIEFRWVKGHQNNEFNNLADSLAVASTF